MEAPHGILNIQVLGLSKQYLDMDDQHKYDACRKVLEEALKHIKLSVSLEEKKAYMNGIFSKSIAYYEKIEEYENCVLIKDLQEVLTQII